ncbi:MobA/MobL family protein [Ochrobactrum sp. BH3]|uniref:MobA/MobL family protein n=1 Tax=Brucella pituitosa TaxID=571256 RepID=UPI0010D1DE85|nr:MobA/MobL family protein [Brucella pituitosa]TCQ73041.1 MobA/MobL family protein [Ochrobactrum sp. BH3]
MAITHFRVNIITARQSVVWRAAQYHRVRMLLKMQGKESTSECRGLPDHAEVMLPVSAPRWIVDIVESVAPWRASQDIWNKITMEERANGQLAREIVVALPVELNRDQNIALMRDFIELYLVSLGVVVDWVFRDECGNPHVRILHTLRPIGDHGFGPKFIPVREGDGNPVRCDDGNKIVYQALVGGGRNDLLKLRNDWGVTVNRHLEMAGHEARIDVRSYDVRGIEKMPDKHTGGVGMAIDMRKESA